MGSQKNVRIDFMGKWFIWVTFAIKKTPPKVAMKFQNMITKIQKSLSKSKKIQK